MPMMRGGRGAVEVTMLGCWQVLGASPDAEFVLEDGTRYTGYSFGGRTSVSGEVVFNTGQLCFTRHM